MSNDKNMTQLISLLLVLYQWTTDKYVTRLVDINLSQVIDEAVFHLTCEVDKIQEEADTFVQCLFYTALISVHQWLMQALPL